MGISQSMTGSPWHVERMHRKEGDAKRHKNKCVYFDKERGFCSSKRIKCFGSAHCDKYSETFRMPRKTNIIPKTNLCPYKKGTMVEHKIFGIGEIINVKEDIMEIQFVDVGIKKLSYQKCLELKNMKYV